MRDKPEARSGFARRIIDALEADRDSEAEHVASGICLRDASPLTDYAKRIGFIAGLERAMKLIADAEIEPHNPGT